MAIASSISTPRFCGASQSCKTPSAPIPTPEPAGNGEQLGLTTESYVPSSSEALGAEKAERSWGPTGMALYAGAGLAALGMCGPIAGCAVALAAGVAVVGRMARHGFGAAPIAASFVLVGSFAGLACAVHPALGAAAGAIAGALAGVELALDPRNAPNPK